MQREKVLKPPDISVCIANYNGVGVIEECIESVLKQNFTGDYEVLVHDDASQDDSTAVIGANYPGVKLITSDANLGYCKSNNRLAGLAKGRYLLFLNNDAVLYDNALHSMYSAAERAREDNILSVTQYNIQTGNIIDHGYFLDPFFNPIPNPDTSIEDVSMVIGACLWVSRGQWDRVQGFPEWFDTLAEDMYLCMFAIISGNNVKVVSNSGYKHHVGYSLGGGKVKNNKLATSFKRRRFSERNKTYVLCLFTPTLFLAPLLITHLFMLIVEGVILSLIKRDIRIWGSIYFFTFVSLWKNRGVLLRERRKVQKHYKITTKKYLTLFRWCPHKMSLLLSHGVPSIK